MFTQFANWILFGSAIYHFMMGFFCLLGPKHIHTALKRLYRIQLPEKIDPLAEFIQKPLGAFAIWTGFVCAVAFAFPGTWSPYIKLGLAILFAMRAIFRSVYRDFFASTMGVSWQRSRANVIFNIFLVIALSLSLIETGF